MPNHNNPSDTSKKRQTPKHGAPPPSRSETARKLALARYREKNKVLLREKALERKARHHLKVLEDPQAAAAAAIQKRLQDANYRAKHRGILKMKAALRREDEYWRQHHAHRPTAEKRDYKTELMILEDDRWLNAMPPHRRQGASGVAVPLALVLHLHHPKCQRRTTTATPTIHRDPIWDPSTATGLWLVTSQDVLAPGPGVYTSWEACSAICEGVSGAGAVFYNTELDCYAAWHARCRLGEHAHPAEPQTPRRGPDHLATDALIFKDLHFAVRGGETIYSDLGAAVAHYQKVQSDGDKAELLATQNYMKALYFARGANEWTAERLALETSSETRDRSVVPRLAAPCPAPAADSPAVKKKAAMAADSPAAQREAATASRLAAIEASVVAAKEEKEKKQRAKASRLAAIEAVAVSERIQEEKERELASKRRTIISEYLASTPFPSKPSPFKPPRFKPSSSTSSVSTPTTPTPSKPFKASGFSTPIKIGGRVAERTPKSNLKGKGPLDGNESDALYETLGDDELAEILLDWVEPEDRFDPRTENRPRDDA
ncbi:hypothetical protein C8F04DRAFT_1272611 [Mycena alexandri]|uniref:Uncharacterized protein n=1 Tax=Mycena alexandri TaxID=1745969 RepID=A0AAD6S7C8_9AGAR|nr:hypothetical protein C8F04DRAFT_1272611 [Mycena alexandri]